MKLGERIARILGRKKPNEHKLGDFTTTSRVIPITLLAIGIGIFSAFVALALLRLIGIFTNLFFYQRWGTALVSPACGPVVRRGAPVSPFGLGSIHRPVAGASLTW